MKRNTLVLSIVLLLLAVFAWAGWANWESRKQAAEKRLATAAKAELVADNAAAGGDIQHFATPLLHHPAPNFTLEDLSGKKVALDSYKGKAVLINFWATWCGPCKIETPWLVELRDQYASKGFEVLGISADDLDLDNKKMLAEEKRDIAKFAQEEHMQYPILINGTTLDKPYGGLDALPTSYFIDRNGNVVAAEMGLTSKADLEGNIRKALGE